MFAPRPLFPSFPPFFPFPTICPISHFTNSPSLHLYFLYLLCSFILSFSFPDFHRHFSHYSLLPGLHATKEDKVVSIFFFWCSLSVLWMWCLCQLKVKKKCWLCSNLELRSLLSVLQHVDFYTPERWWRIFLILVSSILARPTISQLKEKKGLKTNNIRCKRASYRIGTEPVCVYKSTYGLLT